MTASLAGATLQPDGTPAPPVTAPPKTTFRRGDGRAALGFLAPNVAGFLIFTLFPLVASLVMAFFMWPLLGDEHFVGFGNFWKLLTGDPQFGQVLLNTVGYVIGYMVLNVVLSLGIASWLSGKIRGKAILRVIFFLPVITPMVANAVVWKLLFAEDGGLVNWVIGLVGIPPVNWLGSAAFALPAVIVMSVWAGFGYNMIVFTAGLEAIPQTVHEAAMLDGSTGWHKFFTITLPLLSPSVFFAGVMTLITSFQVFIQPYVLTNFGPGNSTTTLVGYLYQHGFQAFQLGYAAAIGWILFIIIMIITAVQFRLQRRWVHYD